MLRGSTLGLAILVIVALLACKKETTDSGGEGSKCASDGDCKNGFLCESVCLPADKVTRMRDTKPRADPPNALGAAASAVAPTATATAPSDGISRMSGAGMKSKVPTVQEWDAIGEITVAHSTPLGCETKMVREWLRVSCRTAGSTPHQIQTVKMTKDTGLAKFEVFTYTNKGVASVVMPIRAGLDAAAQFTWSDWGTRTLSAKMDNGQKIPSIAFDAPPPK